MKLPRLFKRPIQLTGRIYNAWDHTGWGNSIRWSNYESRRVVGCLSRSPQVGDEIRFEMKSGKTARFAVISVEPCSDPEDMFFADVMDIGYLGEKSINKVREATS